MKKSELTFTVLLVPLDYLLVFAAALTAYSLRLGWFAALRPVILEIPFKEYVLFSAGVAAIFTFFFAISGLYAVTGPRRLRIEVSRVFFACSTAIMTVIALIFFRRELFSSRFIVLVGWYFAVVYVCAGRVVIRMVQRLLLRSGFGTHRVVLIGGNDRVGDMLATEFAGSPAHGYTAVKRLATFDAIAEKEIDEMAKQDKVDEIFITDPDLSRQELSRILGFAESRHLAFRYSADLLATHAKNIEIGTIAGIPIVEIKGTRLEGWGRIFKRVFDIVGSALLIVLTSPIMILAALAIVIDSRGPVFWSRLDDGTPATRIGEHGRPFRYFKFRSMKPGMHNLRYTDLAAKDTRKDGPLVKIKDDPRVTRVGKFIRKYSIDELPELFLVLIGKMSLVGPRPHLPEEVAKYTDHQRRVMTVKPGITGMAQVSGRADLTFEDEVKLDTYYIENWTPWTDLAILAKTPFVVLNRKGAY